jgi:hypothetical protein
MNLVTFKSQYIDGRAFAYALTGEYDHELKGELFIEFSTPDARDEFLATINILIKTEIHHRSQFFNILLAADDFDTYDNKKKKCFGMRWLWYKAIEAKDAFDRLIWLTKP